MKSHFIALLGFLVLSCSKAYSQVDFDHYSTLLANGAIPKDFSSNPEDKYLELLNKNKELYSTTDKKKFLLSSTKAIDELLHSGLVIYGDDISMYINDVANKLLSNDPALKSELRFYLLKSNVTNALSTNQGIIFVTTGLIAELTSEAQLAYILAHEIAHFKENHSLKSYEWSTSQRGQSIIDMSTFSKENEFEADKLGVEMYKKAGYDPNEILGVFDVLMYSYLPFDEIPMPKEYIGGNKIYFPEGVWGKKTYPITAQENYDDSKSTHPNIKKRKLEAEKTAQSFKDWEDGNYFLGKENFEYIRNIARFESVRIDVSEANYTNAIYSIFLLEKEFPTSTFLAEMKAMSWLGIYQYTANSKKSSIIPKTKYMEGEIAIFQDYIKNASKDAITVLAIRNIYDITNKFPENELIQQTKKQLFSSLNNSSNFNWSNYSKKSFQESAALALIVKDSMTTKASSEIPTEKNTKYDRIKTKKSFDSPESFDSTLYHVYGIYDIVNDSLFTASTKLFSKDETESNLDFNQLNIISYGIRTSSHMPEKKQEKLLDNLIEGIEIATNATLKVEESNLQKELNSTAEFNQEVINAWLKSEIEQAQEIPLVVTDYYLVKEMIKEGGTPNIGFVSMSYFYNPDLSSMLVTASTIFGLPIALVVLAPMQLMQGQQTDLKFHVYNLSKGKTDVIRLSFENKPNKFHIANHLNAYLKQNQSK